MSIGDLDQGDQVGAECPACETVGLSPHELLKVDVPATVRCLACDHVHKYRLEDVSRVTVRVVVSMGDESLSTVADVPATETLAVGEEFVVDTEEAIIGVRITSLELDGNRRAHIAEADVIETIWTRAVDNVAINVTINPADGQHDETRSATLEVPGDETLTVGDEITVDGAAVAIQAIRITDDTTGYDRTHIDREGASVRAKDIKRVYARVHGADTWRSPWDDI